MAEISSEQLSEVVARVTSEVIREVEGHERAFGVADLRTHLADLVKVGGGAAWTISYSTKSEGVQAPGDVARIGGVTAWTISYSTSRDIVQAGTAKGQA